MKYATITESANDISEVADDYAESLKTNRSDREAEGLMRRSVIDRIEVDQRQLLRPSGAHQEHSFGLAFAIPAAVRENVRLGAVVRELVFVLAEQSHREIVTAGRVLAIVPGDAVHARVREVLVGLLTEQPQKVHLYHSDRLVSDLENDDRPVRCCLITDRLYTHCI